VNKLETEIKKIGGMLMIADPDTDNIPSIKVLLNNGFKYVKDEYYRKIIR
jgi:RimJ/RimL family protein N-acetyltransferase